MILKDELQKLGWRDFEDLIHDILEAEGFTVEFHSGIGADQGSDLIARYDSFNSLELIPKRYLVQCKKHKRNIAERDLPNIQNKTAEHGCNGYLLVVSSDITENLNKMISKINSPSNFCGVWRQRDIISKLFTHKHILERYFPGFLYEKHEIRDEEIIELFSGKYNRTPDKVELNNYKYFIKLAGFRNISEIREIIYDTDAENGVNELYKKYLSRESDPVGYFIWGHFFRTLPEEVRTDFIIQKLKESDEYRSKIRFLYDINILNPPVCSVEFDAVNQRFYNWRTYHEKYKNGILEVKKIDNPDIGPIGRPYFNIFTLDDKSELRLLFLENINLPNKNILNIDLLFEGLFHIFLFIYASDNKLYYIEYIHGDGEDRVFPGDGRIEYVQIYYKKFYKNGLWLRFDRNFAEDFKKEKNLDILKLINIYLSVKGNLQIFNAIID